MRFELLKLTRQFFWSENFVEVETPTLLSTPGQEPYLSPMEVTMHDDNGKPFQAFLHTSPEYTLKKLLASDICEDNKKPNDYFFLGKCFRDYESFGGTHNPEFTMIEWYRCGVEDVMALAEDIRRLLLYVEKGLEKKFQREIPKLSEAMIMCSMKELWMKIIGVNLDDYLDVTSLSLLCKERGYKVGEDESYEDLFYRIFLSEIENTFLEDQVLFLHTYPAEMAALSQLCENNPGYAQRAEVYIGPLELANGFFELTDPQEQTSRFEQEQKQRKKLNKPVYPIDRDFISALGEIPSKEESKWGGIAGIALGFDRLTLALLSCKNIDNVLTLPASVLFDTDISEEEL